MGLDMYLDKRHYWPISGEAGPVKYVNSPHQSIRPERVCQIDERVMYWRKANQIHRWFVEHVQEGRDECQETEVSKDDLQELLTTVQAVLADHNKAAELLPTMEGFFFGGTAYNADYFGDLEMTAEVLTQELGVYALVGEDCWYIYRASW